MIAESSGFADIDARAIQMVQTIGGKLPAPPKQYLTDGKLKLTWHVVFPEKKAG